MILSELIVWLLVVTSPNVVVVDRYDSFVACTAAAERQFKKPKPMYKGKCIRVVGTLAPI